MSRPAPLRGTPRAPTDDLEGTHESAERGLAAFVVLSTGLSQLAWLSAQMVLGRALSWIPLLAILGSLTATVLLARGLPLQRIIHAALWPGLVAASLMTIGAGTSSAFLFLLSVPCIVITAYVRMGTPVVGAAWALPALSLGLAAAGFGTQTMGPAAPWGMSGIVEAVAVTTLVLLLTVVSGFRFVGERAVSRHERAERIAHKVSDAMTQRSEELEHRLTEVEERATHEARFAGAAISEMRPPLARALHLAEVIEYEVGASEEVRELLEHVSEACSSSLALANDFLLHEDLLEAPHLGESDTLDLAALAARVIQEHEPAARSKGLELSLVLDEELPLALSGDADMLARALSILIRDAVAATSAGGVTLILRTLASPDSNNEAPDCWALGFRIEDTGPGLAEQELERALEPDGDRRRAHLPARLCGQTGMGLHVVRELLGLLGTQLRADSRGQMGSSFEFILNLQESILPVREPETPGIAARTAQLDGRRVLVVDSHAVGRLVTRKLLQRAGLDARDVAGASLASSLVASSDFELVLAQVDDERGINAVRAVRSQSSSIPILVRTSGYCPTREQELLELGVERVLVEPCPTAHLLSALRATLREHPNASRAA